MSLSDNTIFFCNAAKIFFAYKGYNAAVNMAEEVSHSTQSKMWTSKSL